MFSGTDLNIIVIPFQYASIQSHSTDTADQVSAKDMNVTGTTAH